MILQINTTDSTPVYEQISRQIKNAVISGELVPGAPLPAIRQLATDLELNPNTVAKAFQLLERNQIIFTAGRKGSFVHKLAKEKAEQYSQEQVAQKLADIIDISFDQGLNAQQITNIFKEQLNIAKRGLK